MIKGGLPQGVLNQIFNGFGFFRNGVLKQFGVACWATNGCGLYTGWYRPDVVMDWIYENSDYKHKHKDFAADYQEP